MKLTDHAFISIHPANKLAVEHDLRDELTAAVDREGTQAVLARDLEVSNAYLGDVLHGRRPISGRLAEKLGWKKMTVFVR